jgi:hypothetical protein
MAVDQAGGPAVTSSARPAEEPGEQTAARLDALLAEVDACADPRLRALAQELVRTLMRFYGSGLDRVATLVSPATLRRLADDDLVGGLLALHDLHPDGITPDDGAGGPAAAGPPQPEGRRVLPLTVAPVRPPAAAAAAGARS